MNDEEWLCQQIEQQRADILEAVRLAAPDAQRVVWADPATPTLASRMFPAEVGK